jgi:glucose/arabinose dehydrogenase
VPALDLPTLLAAAYAPLLPLLKRIRIVRRTSRRYEPRDILVPNGYCAEIVASGFNGPVHCAFDDKGFCYVAEAGHKIEATPRILKVDVRSGEWSTIFTLPEHLWNKTGALTGLCFVAGDLYFTNTDSVCRLTREGMVETIVDGLPGRGDHQVNYPVAGPDGNLYFGVGSATNTGIVGADNAAYEWLPQFPEFCDSPARDVVLAGRNYESPNVLGDVTQKVRTGAYVPFGTETHPGQTIRGSTKCTGAVLRCAPDGNALSVVAWGLRNPYGIALHPDGRLFVTEHGSDERSARQIIGDLDDLYEIRDGAWYGWPDFASGIRMDDEHWGRRGQGREPVLAEFPDPDPPKPFVSFQAHAAANGIDFSRDARFGFVGDAFVALFGDLAPVTTPRLSTPAGFKVVRVDMRERRIVDFAVNKYTGPASLLPHDGFERPSHCAFGPDGALYVVDWGEINIAPEAGGIRMPLGGGALWRISRTADPPADVPPAAKTIPLYAATAALVVAGVTAATTIAVLLARWMTRKRR